MRIAFLASAVAAALLVVSGCGVQGEPPSAKRLAALTSHGVHVDYTPLASPRDALTKGDLVTFGTLTDVVDGVVVTHLDARENERQAGAYATFVLTVDEVISGDPAKLRDRRVYVTVNKSRATEIAALARANSHPRVVAVLDDISDWKPSPDATVTRSAALPPGAPLYFAYSDGLWLQDDDDAAMTGVYAEPRDLPAAWNGPKAVAEVAASLRAARRQNWPAWAPRDWMVFDAEQDVKSELSGQPQFERDATKQFVERLFSGYAVQGPDGQLRRALSLSTDVIENGGERLPFEQPFWAGDHPAIDPEDDDDDDPYPLRFDLLEPAAE